MEQISENEEKESCWNLSHRVTTRVKAVNWCTHPRISRCSYSCLLSPRSGQLMHRTPCMVTPCNTFCRSNLRKLSEFTLKGHNSILGQPGLGPQDTWAKTQRWALNVMIEGPMFTDVTFLRRFAYKWSKPGMVHTCNWYLPVRRIAHFFKWFQFHQVNTVNFR